MGTAWALGTVASQQATPRCTQKLPYSFKSISLFIVQQITYDLSHADDDDKQAFDIPPTVLNFLLLTFHYTRCHPQMMNDTPDTSKKMHKTYVLVS